MRAACLAVVLMLSPLAQAAGESPSAVIAVGYSPQTPAVKLQRTADYVAVPITIQNDAKDPVSRAHEIERTLRVVTEKMAQDGELKIKPGVVSLSPREHSKAYSGYDASGGSAQLYVLGALKPDSNIYALSKRIYQALHSVPLAEGTRIAIGNTQLALDDPEKYRNQLLGLVSKSIAEAKKSLGIGGGVKIDGLENPVVVMQVNEREVLVFINYRLRIDTRPGP